MFKNNKLLLILKCAWPQATFYICDLQPATCKIALPVEEVLSEQYLSNTKETSMQAQLIKAFIGEHI